MTGNLRIRMPALEDIVVGYEIEAFLGPDNGPSTVRILEASADMLPILERHAGRQFAAPVEEAAS